MLSEFATIIHDDVLSTLRMFQSDQYKNEISVKEEKTRIEMLKLIDKKLDEYVLTTDKMMDLAKKGIYPQDIIYSLGYSSSIMIGHLSGYEDITHIDIIYHSKNVSFKISKHNVNEIKIGLFENEISAKYIEKHMVNYVKNNGIKVINKYESKYHGDNGFMWMPSWSEKIFDKNISWFDEKLKSSNDLENRLLCATINGIKINRVVNDEKKILLHKELDYYFPADKLQLKKLVKGKCIGSYKKHLNKSYNYILLYFKMFDCMIFNLKINHDNTEIIYNINAYNAFISHIDKTISLSYIIEYYTKKLKQMGFNVTLDKHLDNNLVNILIDK